MSIGMSYNEYWNEDPHKVHYYLEMDKLVKQRENEKLWLQGLYVYNAISSFIEILPAFPKKNAKVRPYIDSPIPLTTKDMEEKKEKERQQKFEKMKQKMIQKSLEINKGK